MSIKKTWLLNAGIGLSVLTGMGVLSGTVEARNYGSAVPNWVEECGGPSLGGEYCNAEESTEHAKNGSYKEEVQYESGPGDNEETREIAAEGENFSECGTYLMLRDFAWRLGRWTKPGQLNEFNLACGLNVTDPNF